MHQLRARLKGFARATEGVAVIEFALIMPLLLLLYFGSVEASSMFTVDRRVTIIAGTVGDLVAQWDPDNGDLPQASYDDYFAAAETIMTPYSANTLQQVVSFVWVNADTGATKVLWSRATGGGTARVVGSIYPLDAGTQLNQLARTDGYFVASEAAYSYEPVLGLVFTDPITLGHTSYFLPRFGECIKVNGSACS